MGNSDLISFHRFDESLDLQWDVSVREQMEAVVKGIGKEMTELYRSLTWLEGLQR